MAKHRQARHAHTQGRRSGRATALRATMVAVALVICVAGSIKLFSSASSAADNSHAASLHGARGARLHPPGGAGRHGGRRHRKGKAGSPAATPSPSPSPVVPKHISGSQVTAVGDSVMVASTPALDQALPGIEINAQVGRQFSTGLQVIESLKAAGQLRPIVVMALGTNGTVTTQEIGQLYAEIGPHRLLVLVNTYEARSWEQEVNSTLAGAARSHPGTVLADWYDAIDHRTNLLWPDGIHPQPAGGTLYARILKRALNELINLP